VSRSGGSDGKLSLAQVVANGIGGMVGGGIFAAVNLTAWRLRARTAIRPAVPLLGALFSLAAIALETLVAVLRGQRPKPNAAAGRAA
jgi:hypothetical protein